VPSRPSSQLDTLRQKSATKNNIAPINKASDLLNPSIHQEIIYEKVGIQAAPVKKLSQTLRPKSVDMSAARTRVTSARDNSSANSTIRPSRRQVNMSMANIDVQPLVDKSMGKIVISNGG